MVKRLNEMPKINCTKPEGAFYAFPKVSGLYNDELNDSFKFCEFLLEKARVAVIPGGAFGEEADNYIRFSYATNMQEIEEGLKRIREVL